MTLDLDQLFTDEDGDANFRYHLENAPDWLKLVNVSYGTDGSVTGELTGTVPPGIDKSAFDVMLVATDEAGGRGMTKFNIIVDDGNDAITGINLTNADGTDNAFKTVSLPENDTSGMVIGTLSADDLDNPRHPNGMHTFEVAKSQQDTFEIAEDGVTLKVKDGVALDHEPATGGANSIEVSITAKDGGGESLTQSITVNVTDNNDAPSVKNEPGNWWVTVDEDLDADDVTEPGEWLKFSLETGNDLRALFQDPDAGEVLTYSIVSGPSWLEIDGKTGDFDSKKGTVPTRGIHDVHREGDRQGGCERRGELPDRGRALRHQPAKRRQFRTGHQDRRRRHQRNRQGRRQGGHHHHRGRRPRRGRYPPLGRRASRRGGEGGS